MEKFGAVSFSGETRAGPFYEQIHSGRKTLTLRERRKDGKPHVKVGYLFTMYWKMRTPKKKQEELPIYYIGMAECIAYEAIKIVDHWNDEEFAKSDGFQDLEEFRDMWFPEWREAPWLDDVVEAYEVLKKEDYIFEEIISFSRRFGKSTIMDFMQLEYMMIKWKLVEKGMMTEAKYGYHKTGLDEGSIEDINELNFENWIHQNEELFKFIYIAHYKGREPCEVTEFYRDSGDHGRAWLTKLLKRGVQFGVISNGRIVADSGRPRLYRATKAGVEYYEKMLKERIESSLS